MKNFRLLFIAALLAVIPFSLSCSSSAPEGTEQVISGAPNGAEQFNAAPEGAGEFNAAPEGAGEFNAAPERAGQFNAAPDGAELYRARCGTCHGEKGEGLVSAGVPPVNKTPMTIGQLVSLIMEGKSGTNVHYSPIVNVTGEEAQSIAEYMKTLE